MHDGHHHDHHTHEHGFETIEQAKRRENVMREDRYETLIIAV